MSVIKRMQAGLANMSNADRDIATFIIEHPDLMLGLSSTELAREAGRGQSSVVKFAQRLGFSTYQDLKLSIGAARAQERGVPGRTIHGPIEQSDALPDLSEKLLALKYAALRNTIDTNGMAVVHRAAAALNEGRRIYVFGVGASSLVAADLSYKLQKIGRLVLQNGDAHIHMANTADIAADDVMIAISHSGMSRETLEIAAHARSLGAQVVAITGIQGNPLAAIADIVLHTVVEEEHARSSSITARDAQLALTDVLFLMLVQRQDDAGERIVEAERAVAGFKTGATIHRRRPRAQT